METQEIGDRDHLTCKIGCGRCIHPCVLPNSLRYIHRNDAHRASLPSADIIPYGRGGVKRLERKLDQSLSSDKILEPVLDRVYFVVPAMDFIDVAKQGNQRILGNGHRDGLALVVIIYSDNSRKRNLLLCDIP